MIDKYLIQRKSQLSLDFIEELNFDIFISIYNESFRGRCVIDRIGASRKAIFTHPKYIYQNDLPDFVIAVEEDKGETYYVETLFSKLSPNIKKDSNICIDITGFLRPDLMYILKYLKDNKYSRITLLYAEPVKYKNKEATTFSDSFIKDVYPVEGYYSTANVETDRDMLIIGTGYDSSEIRDVADKKSQAHIYRIFSLPSITLDMYQENRLSVYDAQDSMKRTRDIHSNYFSPAYDPFETCNVLKKIIDEYTKINQGFTNLYLSPLGPKPQVVGFALFYLEHFEGKNAGILFPYYNSYKTNICDGINRIWKYEVVF